MEMEQATYRPEKRKPRSIFNEEIEDSGINSAVKEAAEAIKGIELANPLAGETEEITDAELEARVEDAKKLRDFRERGTVIIKDAGKYAGVHPAATPDDDDKGVGSGRVKKAA